MKSVILLACIVVVTLLLVVATAEKHQRAKYVDAHDDWRQREHGETDDAWARRVLRHLVGPTLVVTDMQSAGLAGVQVLTDDHPATRYLVSAARAVCAGDTPAQVLAAQHFAEQCPPSLRRNRAS